MKINWKTEENIELMMAIIASVIFIMFFVVFGIHF